MVERNGCHMCTHIRSMPKQWTIAVFDAVYSWNKLPSSFGIPHMTLWLLHSELKMTVGSSSSSPELCSWALVFGGASEPSPCAPVLGGVTVLFPWVLVPSWALALGCVTWPRTALGRDQGFFSFREGRSLSVVSSYFTTFYGLKCSPPSSNIGRGSHVSCSRGNCEGKQQLSSWHFLIWKLCNVSRQCWPSNCCRLGLSVCALSGVLRDLVLGTILADGTLLFLSLPLLLGQEQR